MYKKRLITDRVKKALEFFPVIAVVGARQTGKSTLVKHEFPERNYISLDLLEVRAAVDSDPYGFISAQHRPITLDEVQRVPTIFEIIKVLVDRSRTPGEFLLTGSANFLMLKKVSETLAGRIAIFELTGFTISEIKEVSPSAFLQICLRERKIPIPEYSPPDISLESLVIRGSLPPAVLAPDKELCRLWLENYIITYLERDLRELSQVASLGDYRRLMGLAALRTSKVLNISELARDSGISVSTTRNYLHLLEISYQIRRLLPYFSNISKRLIKSPKLHFKDTGVALVLSGIPSKEKELRLNPFYHSLVETYIVEEIVKLLNILVPEARVYYFRTHAGAEVDLVIEAGDRLLPIEIKASSNVSLKKVAGLRQFLKDFKKRAPFGLVLYTGDKPFKASEDIAFIPWSYVLIEE